MAVGWQQLLIVLVLVLVLFGGRGRISSLMGDMAKGIKSFRSGLKEDDEPAADGTGDGATNGRADAATLTAAPPPGDPAVTTEPVSEAPARRDA